MELYPWSNRSPNVGDDTDHSGTTMMTASTAA